MFTAYELTPSLCGPAQYIKFSHFVPLVGNFFVKFSNEIIHTKCMLKIMKIHANSALGRSFAESFVIVNEIRVTSFPSELHDVGQPHLCHFFRQVGLFRNHILPFSPLPTRVQGYDVGREKARFSASCTSCHCLFDFGDIELTTRTDESRSATDRNTV